jgi:hypothetical protein
MPSTSTDSEDGESTVMCRPLLGDEPSGVRIVSAPRGPAAVRPTMPMLGGRFDMRVRTIVHQAELACWSPMRLWRWRLVMPDETLTGIAPRSAARDFRDHIE